MINGDAAAIANDGETALKMFDSFGPDLLLLDIASNNINDITFSTICSAVVDNKEVLALEELWIGGCQVMNNGIIMLASLIRNGYLPRLTVLCADSGCGGKV